MNELPISHILPELKSSLKQHSRLVVVAPPGAGKSTLLPLALLENASSTEQIWLLEPRRLAASQVAARLASSLNEPLGQSIGLITGDSQTLSKDNKLVVMTEGVLAQRFLKENDIGQCATIIFDEFHERSLQSDLALALAVQCQEYLRDDLKLIIMSATLDSDELETKLSANTLTSEGRSYPVEVHYRPISTQANGHISKAIYQAIQFALNQHSGDVLVFLPGMKEINQTLNEFDDVEQQDLNILPLHGSLNVQAQQAILKPSGKRKIILATDIAKTSLTIEGITVVIDSGLERLAQFNSKTQMNELITVKASQASCIQRSGRAGRLQAGVAYRLFSQDDFKSRNAFSPKAIEKEDLSQFALSLSAWGSLDLNDYFLLTPPNEQRWQKSLQLLQQLNVLNPEHQLTHHGQQMSTLPLHPRLSHMLMAALALSKKSHGPELAYSACFVAAILSEGDPLYFEQSNSDLDIRLQLFELQSIPRSFQHGQVKHHVAKRIKQLAQRLAKTLNNQCKNMNSEHVGLLLMLAYPDRLAQKRGKGYRLMDGPGCQLLEDDALVATEYLAIAHVSSMVRNAGTQNIIRLAASINKSDILGFNEHLIIKKSHLKKNEHGRLLSTQQTCLGNLILEETQQAPSKTDQFEYWRQSVKENGLAALHLTESDTQTLKRLQLAHEHFPNDYANFDEAVLINELNNWLVPFIQVENFNEAQLQKINLSQALLSRLDWNIQQQLDKDFPLKLALPSGRNCQIDYSQAQPFAKAKLQEFFGLEKSPTLARGNITLSLHLLSPAQRPLAQTSDLAFFWQQAYPEVRKENRGRYAKHPWPEDPLTAVASHKLKKHM